MLINTDDFAEFGAEWFLFGDRRAVVVQFAHPISALLLFAHLDLGVVGAAVEHGRVRVGVEVFGFPVCPHEPSRPLKVRGRVEMLFLPLNLRLDPGPRLAPLVHQLPCLFVSPFFLQFSVLLFPPHGFKLLLVMLVGRVVIKVAGTALKPILRVKPNFLVRALVFCQVCRPVRVKRFGPDCLLRSFEGV